MPAWPVPGGARLRFAIFYTNCMTGCCVRSLTPTGHPHPCRYEKPYAPSIFTSQKPSTMPGCCQSQPEISRQLSTAQ